MMYGLVFIVLIISEILYFKLANRLNIIDKPNERSSHSKITLRGGGIIFYISIVIYFFWSGFQYPWFFAGLSLMSFISFADDVVTLPNKIRLFVHFVSVLLMGCQLQVFDFPWYILLMGFVFIVGVINAYNFMDGINGITAANSFAVGVLLCMVNVKEAFIDQNFLIFSLISILVFSIFNFRNRAVCFAGDVGSVSIAFILLFALGSLILKTENLIYLLFLSMYGIDTVWTIIERLLRKENIFKAHRSHLYQYLANEAGVNKLLISFLYGLIQFFIGLIVINISHRTVGFLIVFSLFLISLLSVLYCFSKKYVVKKFIQ